MIEKLENRLERMFNRKLADLFTFQGNEESEISGFVGSVNDLIPTFVRFTDKYALFISYVNEEEEYDQFMRVADEHFKFLDKLTDHEQVRFLNPLFISGWSLLLFDEKETVNQYYSEIDSENADPFYACTYDKRGVPLTENT